MTEQKKQRKPRTPRNRDFLTKELDALTDDDYSMILKELQTLRGQYVRAMEKVKKVDAQMEDVYKLRNDYETHSLDKYLGRK